MICVPCGAPLSLLRARHFAVVEGRLVPFCSPECKARGNEPVLPFPEAEAAWGLWLHR